MQKKVLLAWSSGKDSAWTLYELDKQPEFEIVGLFCTVNRKFERVAMHAVRRELLEMQAHHVGLPLHVVDIPDPCSNEEYQARMAVFVDSARDMDVEAFAFGDLYLEDIRQYREQNLKDTGIEPIFPLWEIPTTELSRKMVKNGLRAIITCVDPRKLPVAFAGREYNQSFLDELPDDVDPCGEKGEFHSFAFAGPMFRKPLDVVSGKIVQRAGFVFADLKPAAK
ncbi:ATP-binding protein [Thermodesulfobacteriota bacterium]